MAIDDQLATLARSIADLANENGAEQRACDALASLNDRWHSPRLPVIVVGEVSSGKSTLVNALVEKRLLPSDFRVSTSAWTHISHGPVLAATAFVQSADGAEAVDLDPDVDLPVYLTVGGYERLATRHGDTARVISVDIAVPAPVLESGLELLDTPGVGGLRAAHRRTTFAAMAEADAVLFVTKPGEPLSKSELTTLAEAVDRVHACVIVHTHRDERADADQALKDDLALLTDAKRWMALLNDHDRADALALRFGSVSGVSVSASNALDAVERAAGPVRQHLLDASNLAVLREVLDNEVVAHGHTIHRGNIVRLMEILLASIRARVTERITILRGGAAAADAIEKLEKLIAKWLAHNGDYWRREFEADCAKIPGQIDEFARTRVAELTATHRWQFAKMKPAQLREAMTDLVTEPETALADMVQLAGDGIDAATGRVTRMLKSEGLGSGREQLEGTAAVFDRLRQLPDTARAPGDVEDVRSGLMGGLAGLGATTVAAGVLQSFGLLTASAAVPVLLPIAIGAAIFVAINRHRRAKARTVEAATEVLAAVCREVTTTAANSAKQAVVSAKNRTAQEIDEALAEEAARIRQARQDLSESASLTPEQRALHLAEAADVLTRVGELARQLADLKNTL